MFKCENMDKLGQAASLLLNLGDIEKSRLLTMLTH